MHTWLNMTEGEVRDKTRDEIIQVATQNKIDRDMAWEASRIHDSFKAFADALHIQLHDLALANQPLGLATFGLPAEADLRLFTVMQMLGKPFIAALQPKDHEEMIVGDYKKLRDTPVWKLLDKHVRQNEPYTGDAKVGEMLAKAREYWPNQGDGELSPSLAMKLHCHLLRRRSGQKSGRTAHRTQPLRLRSFTHSYAGGLGSRARGNRKTDRPIPRKTGRISEETRLQFMIGGNHAPFRRTGSAGLCRARLQAQVR
ncbi:MAG: cobaltochelatase subunit CobN [Methylobacter sp.]